MESKTFWVYPQKKTRSKMPPLMRTISASQTIPSASMSKMLKTPVTPATALKKLSQLTMTQEDGSSKINYQS